MDTPASRGEPGPSPVDAFVFDFVTSLQGPFTSADLVRGALERGIALPGSVGKAAADGTYPKLGRVLLTSTEWQHLAFSRGTDELTPRAWFFRGAKFLVSPIAEELAEGILIPGHRFEPFRGEHVAPWEVKLTGPDGELLRTLVAQRPLQEITRCCQLLGPEEVSDILLADQPANVSKLAAAGDPPPVVEITAFDTREMWLRLGVGPGSFLECTLEDWATGRVSFRVLPAEEVLARKDAAPAWRERLEGGFLRAFDEVGPSVPMREQIAWAYWFAGREVLDAPPMNLGALVNDSRRVSYRDLGSAVILWHADREVGDHAFWEGEPRESVGLDGSLDDILDDVGISLSAADVEAYMRDQLRQGEGGIEEVVKRAFASLVLTFHDPEQEAAFRRFLFALWARVERGYDRQADGRAGVVRSRMLALLDDHLAWLRGLDRRGFVPEDLPAAEMTELAGYMGRVGAVLAALNELRDDGIPEEATDQLVEAANAATAGLRGLVSAIEAKLPGAKAPRKPPKSRAPKEPPAVAVLKVTLVRTSPPVWRRISVPVSLNLGDLHFLIQDAMGWTYSHLHAFRIGTKEYGDPSIDDGFAEYLDESCYALSSVLPAIGKSFRYEYDFGDGWEHKITVEKLLPPEPSRLPRCLAGKRACPPEDCGGVGGYADLVRLKSTPPGDLSQGDREYLEWAGEWDPDHFDPQEVDRLYRRQFEKRLGGR